MTNKLGLKYKLTLKVLKGVFIIRGLLSYLNPKNWRRKKLIAATTIPTERTATQPKPVDPLFGSIKALVDTGLEVKQKISNTFWQEISVYLERELAVYLSRQELADWQQQLDELSLQSTQIQIQINQLMSCHEKQLNNYCAYSTSTTS